MTCHQDVNGYPNIYDVQDLNETTPISFLPHSSLENTY